MKIRKMSIKGKEKKKKINKNVNADKGGLIGISCQMHIDQTAKRRGNKVGKEEHYPVTT